MDEEDIHVCPEHMEEAESSSYDEMMAKYPLAGSDDRNPEFFRRFDSTVSQETEDPPE
jgi:hypothetical protein